MTAINRKRHNRTDRDSVMAFLPRHGSSRGEVIGLQSVCEEYKAVRVKCGPVANQSDALRLTSAHRCLFHGFQGFNHKCGPVLPRFFIEPNALNHLRPAAPLATPSLSEITFAITVGVSLRQARNSSKDRPRIQQPTHSRIGAEWR